jgi:2-amino-4-hydroxy-6-hydroxymethyldihydropteridine diphosphokinase
MLLRQLHAIEARTGRTRTQRWGPRVLDLDLLAVAECVRPDTIGLQKWIDLPPDQQMSLTPDEMLLPHPRLQDRAFVLGPLCDVMPHWRHPVTRLTARAMWSALPHAHRNGVKPLQIGL